MNSLTSLRGSRCSAQSTERQVPGQGRRLGAVGDAELGQQFVTCTLTVFSLMNSRSAIARLVAPVARTSSTSRSRAVRMSSSTRRLCRAAGSGADGRVAPRPLRSRRAPIALPRLSRSPAAPSAPRPARPPRAGPSPTPVGRAVRRPRRRASTRRTPPARRRPRARRPGRPAALERSVRRRPPSCDRPRAAGWPPRWPTCVSALVEQVLVGRQPRPLGRGSRRRRPRTRGSRRRAGRPTSANAFNILAGQCQCLIDQSVAASRTSMWRSTSFASGRLAKRAELARSAFDAEGSAAARSPRARSSKDRRLTSLRVVRARSLPRRARPPARSPRQDVPRSTSP